MAHQHSASCSHGHDHDHDHSHDGHDHGHPEPQADENNPDWDKPAEADIDLDAMHPEVKLPEKKVYPLTEQELRDDFMMITEDGGIKKKMITESKQPELGKPPQNALIFCHYVGTLPNQNDEKFDSSRDRGQAFEFKLGQGRVIKGWDVGIGSMHKGEKCILRCSPEYAYGEAAQGSIPSNSTLDFEVELIDWDDWTVVSGHDDQLKKKILIASEGGFDDEVKPDFTIDVSYKFYYLDINGNETVLKDESNKQVTVDDDDQYNEAFFLCVKSMKKGEKALFKIMDHGLLTDVYCPESKTQVNGDTINEANQLYYQCQVHEITKCKERFNSTNEERIEMGQQYKASGNDFFKQTRYIAAIAKYKKALEWVETDFSDEALNKQKTELGISANNNLALIYIKQKDWSSAMEHASKVLADDPNNLKALIRRGQSYLQNGFLAEAKQDLKRAQSMDKENNFVKKLLQVMKIKQKEYREKQKKLYSGMFGGKSANKKSKNKNKSKSAPKKTEKEDVKVEVEVENTSNDQEDTTEDPVVL